MKFLSYGWDSGESYRWKALKCWLCSSLIRRKQVEQKFTEHSKHWNLIPRISSTLHEWQGIYLCLAPEAELSTIYRIKYILKNVWIIVSIHQDLPADHGLLQVPRGSFLLFHYPRWLWLSWSFFFLFKFIVKDNYYILWNGNKIELALTWWDWEQRVWSVLLNVNNGSDGAFTTVLFSPFPTGSTDYT